jgi:hypothetical protein
MPSLSNDNDWVKNDSAKERARRSNVLAMETATTPFLNSLFEQITADLKAFVTEFPEHKNDLTIKERNHSVVRSLEEGKSASVSICVDFHRWKLAWQYHGTEAPSNELALMPKDGSAIAWRDGYALDLSSLSKLILRPLLFPELMDSEGDQYGPAHV